MLPIFCINLERSTDRRTVIEARAHAIGVELTFVDAIDGKIMWETDHLRALADTHYDTTARFKNYTNDLQTNEIACALSHRKAIRTFLESGHPYGIVIEDDILLAENLIPMTERIIEEIGFDVLKLDTPKPNGFKIATFDGYDVVCTDHVTRGGMGIAYSRSGAEKVLRMTERFSIPFDASLRPLWNFDIDALAIYPALVNYELVDSDIGARPSEPFALSPWKAGRRAAIRIYQSYRKRLYAYKWARKKRAIMAAQR